MAAGLFEIKSKRGSLAVFAVMAFTASLIMLGAATKAAGQAATASALSGFGRLWGLSVLGEYDLELKERYGIFAFRGNEEEVSDKLDDYADRTLGEKSYIDYGGADCRLSGYSLAETENFSAQVKKIVVAGVRPAAKIQESAGGEGGTAQEDASLGRRRVEAEWIKKGLPSYGKTDKTYLGGVISKLKAGLSAESISGGLAVNDYITTFFKARADDRELGETYFNCEVEYIISGSLDEEDSAEEVRKKLRNIRNAMNLFYLYSCPPKREAALALATAVTPGPAAALTQAVLLEIWAFAEAENDIKLLYDDKSVPFIKRDENWALSAENVFGGTAEEAAEMLDADASGAEDDKDERGGGSYVEPQAVEGAGYGDYLTILLCGLPEETKLLRVMDLIQLNLKFTYREEFLIQELYTGLDFSLVVNGKDYDFTQSY